MKFFQTMMGKAFYESRVPQIIFTLECIGAQLKRIADALEESNSDYIKKVERCRFCERWEDACECDAEGNMTLNCGHTLHEDCSCQITLACNRRDAGND